MWNWLMGRFVGHGYQAWRAAVLLAIVLAIGWGLFAAAFEAGAMDPTRNGPLPDPEPGMFALDVLVPVVDFNQNFWIPDPDKPWGELSRVWYWVSIAMGWLLTTLLIGSLTGLLKRE